MGELSLVSQYIGYALIAIIGAYVAVLGWWQARVLAGRSMENPDGSTDDWKSQKTHYGIAFADLFLTCPASFIGIALVFVAPPWGFFVLSLIAFWFIWGNTMTTATSLRFERPSITMNWFIAFPSGILVGAAWLVWVFIHVEELSFFAV